MTRFLPLLLVLVMAVAFGWRLTQINDLPAQSIDYHDPMLGKPMPALSLEPLDGEASFTTAELQGKAYLVNVFASWCAGCAIEHNALRKLAQMAQLPLYGIAWKDKPENTRNWLARKGNIYAAIGVDHDGRNSLALGLTGAPETYLVDAQGKIVALYRGVLNDDVIGLRFLPAFQTLERGE